MFTLKRVSTTPASAIRILVDAPQGDGDTGMAQGGAFYFFPPGSDQGESEHGMSEHSARAIMADPAVAVHFECTPELPADETTATGPAAARKRTKGRGVSESGPTAEDGQ